jgi:hypothetical protein
VYQVSALGSAKEITVTKVGYRAIQWPYGQYGMVNCSTAQSGTADPSEGQVQHSTKQDMAQGCMLHGEPCDLHTSLLSMTSDASSCQPDNC